MLDVPHLRKASTHVQIGTNTSIKGLHLFRSKKSKAPPVPSLCAALPVSTRLSSGLKQQPVSECRVGSPSKTCTGALNLRKSQICSDKRCMLTSGTKANRHKAQAVVAAKEQATAVVL